MQSHVTQKKPQKQCDAESFDAEEAPETHVVELKYGQKPKKWA